jgi:glycosyltransferase involved in cell wall biosynthesis
LIRLGLGSADGFIIHSETDKQALESLFPGRPYELTPLPAFSFFRSGHGNRQQAREKLQVQGPALLFFGLIRPYKGLDVLLRALAIVRQRLQVKLLVVGEFYQDRRPTDALVNELGLADAVRIVDSYVPNEEVEDYFLATDLLVMPYRSATQSAIAQIALSFERPALVKIADPVGGERGSVERYRDRRVVSLWLERLLLLGSHDQLDPESARSDEQIAGSVGI